MQVHHKQARVCLRVRTRHSCRLPRLKVSKQALHIRLPGQPGGCVAGGKSHHGHDAEQPAKGDHRPGGRRRATRAAAGRLGSSGGRLASH